MSKVKETETMKMMRGNPMFDALPIEVQSKIIDFTKRSRGRPPATEQMKFDAEQKKRERERGRGRLKAATKRGDIDEFINTLEDMRKQGLLGEKAGETELNKFVKQNPKLMEARKEAVLEQKAEDIARDVMKQSKREVRIEEGAPVKLKVVDEFSGIPSDERTRQKMQEAALIRRAVKKQQIRDREKALMKRSQLSDHFSNYDKSSKTIKVEKKQIKYPLKKVPKQLINDIRDILFKGGLDFDYYEMESVWDNLLDDDSKERLLANDLTRVENLKELMISARQTAEFIPDYLEGNESMTAEERQIEFHKMLIEEATKTRQEKKEQPKTNFDNNEMAGGGIDGKPIQEIKPKDSIYEGNPPIFNDNERILDDKRTDDAYFKEIFKGIDPDSLVSEGLFTDEEVEQFFKNLNEKENRENKEEINYALDQNEILSGGAKDSMFGAQDLQSTRPHNPASRGNFQMDVPDDIDDNPAPIRRGLNAQRIQEVDPDAIDRQDREEGAGTTIALGLGALSNVYRGVFGRDDIEPTRQNNIIEDLNQQIRLMGKRGMYGEAMELKEDNDLYEGVSLGSRLNNLNNYSDVRDYYSNNGSYNPMMLQPKQPQQPDETQLMTQSLMFNKGAGVMGASLPQLRQQQFDYKQADRYTPHDGYSFIRGGRRTQLMLDSEFEP